MKRILFIVIGIIILVVTAVAVLQFTQKDDSPASQIKTPHFVDSTPLHNDVYAAQPINVTVNFNFDLGDGSHISVTDNGGQEWAEGNVLIEDANTALKRKVKAGPLVSN